MTIYFYSHEKKDISRSILQYLHKIEVEVFSNLIPTKNEETSLSKADALVVYDEGLTELSSYFVALAISENKPILFLTNKAGAQTKALQTLRSDKNFKNKLEVNICEAKNVLNILLQFLQKLDQNSGRDVINVKYTLRVSAKMSDYLAWKSQSTAMPKADWIRNLIADTCQNDKDYQNFLNQKYKTQ
jgi:hypothetical protein